MNLAIIGAGNVGSALALKLAKANHSVVLGVRNLNDDKVLDLIQNSRVTCALIAEAVQMAEVVLLATPALYCIDVAKSLGNTTGKVIIDAMNIVKGQGPKGYTNTSQAILDNVRTKDVVKCFNTTGFNVMLDTQFGDIATDAFVAGDSIKGKEVARRLALDVGFAQCYDVGGNDKFDLMEQFAFFWINLALFQGEGRDIAFKLLRR